MFLFVPTHWQVPESASVKVIKEGTEPPLFKQCYEKWTALVLPKAAPRSFSGASGLPPSPTVERKVTDAMAMVKAQKEAGSEDKVHLVTTSPLTGPRQHRSEPPGAL